MNALSNAERQRQWRERRNRLANLGEVVSSSIQPLEKIAQRLGERINWYVHGDSFSEALMMQAEWREHVLERFPDDHHNKEAADHCKWLSAQMNELSEMPDSLKYATSVFEIACSLDEDLCLQALSNHCSVFWRQLGYQNQYENAEDFINSYAELVILAALDDAVMMMDVEGPE